MNDETRVASDHLLHSTVDDYDLNAAFVAEIDLDRAAAIVDALERAWIQSQSVATEQAAPQAEAKRREYEAWSAGQPDGIMEHDDRDAGKWK